MLTKDELALWAEINEIRDQILIFIFGPQPSGDAANEAFNAEFDRLLVRERQIMERIRAHH